MYNLLCVFISQYNNKVDFILAQMEGQREASSLSGGAWPPLPSLGAASVDDKGVISTDLTSPHLTLLSWVATQTLSKQRAMAATVR